jgi:hypothetical protein
LATPALPPAAWPEAHLPTATGDQGLLKYPSGGRLLARPRQTVAERNPAEHYLYQLLDRITAANTHIFRGVYSPEQFSVWLENPKDYQASADQITGRLTMNPQLLLALPSDAAVASVLCHELAHVLLQTKFAAHPDARLDPDWRDAHDRWRYNQDEAQLLVIRTLKAKKAQAAQQLQLLFDGPAQQRWSHTQTELALLQGEGPAVQARRAALESQLQRLLQQDSAHPARAQQLWNELNQTEQQLQRRRRLAAAARQARNEMSRKERSLLSPAAAKNWKEQYADEAGLELYLRAGFAAEDFMKAPIAVLTDFLAATRPNHPALDKTGRGIDDHPTFWWRKRNIADRIRQLRNCPDFRRFVQGNRAVNMLGDGLGQAQSWLRQQGRGR